MILVELLNLTVATTRDVGRDANVKFAPLAMPHQTVTPFLLSAARLMRRRPIDAEQALWWRLRKRQIGGFRFRRQHPIGGFIGDFVCLEANLIVEVDGSQHRGSESDALRTEELRRLGFDVVRFENDRVRAYIDAVCEEILAAAISRVTATERGPSRRRGAAEQFAPHPPPSRAPSPTWREG